MTQTIVRKKAESRSIRDFVENYGAQTSRNTRSTAIRVFLHMIYDIEDNGTDLDKYEKHGNQYLADIRADMDINRGRSMQLVNDLHSYRNQLTNEEKSATSVRGYVTGVILWLEHNGIEVSRGDRKAIFRRTPPNKGETVEENLTREKIRAILSYSTVQGKTLIMTLLSTGMRLHEALNITIDDVNMGTNPPEITIRKDIVKTKIGRTAFLNKEGAEVMREWLRFRLEYIRIKNAKYSKFSPTDENDPRVFPFNEANATELFTRALEKADLAKVDGKTHRHTIHLHSFRKYFRTTLPKGGNGNSVDCTEAIMGHEGYLTGAYRRLTVDDLREFYRSAEHVLYVNDTIALKDPEADQRIARLEEENKELREKYGWLEQMVWKKMQIESKVEVKV